MNRELFDGRDPTTAYRVWFINLVYYEVESISLNKKQMKELNKT